MAQHDRILLVEDDPDQRGALAEILRREGYNVAEAESAEGAVALLQSQPVDLIVTDHDLGGATGTWLAHVAAPSTRPAAVRALLITGHDDVDGGEGVKVLRKPLDVPRFLAEVRDALNLQAPEPVEPDPPQRIVFTLYVSDSLPSRRTIKNLDALLNQYDRSQIGLTVIDLSKQPADQAERHRVVVTPTLLRTLPSPYVWIAGEVSDPAVVAAFLDQAGVEKKH